MPLWQVIGWILTFVLLLGALLREVKRSGREANHPSPYSSEVKNLDLIPPSSYSLIAHSGVVRGVGRKETSCPPASEV